MAQSLRQRTAGVFLCVLPGFMAGGLHAQGMTDPTEPPPIPSSAAPGDTAAPSAPSAPSLQFVMMTGKRTEAIIDGKLVQVGDRVGDSRVVKISQYEATLRGPGGVQTLRMFPEVRMQVSKNSPDNSGAARHDKKIDKK